jgi:hypothetical protein
MINMIFGRYLDKVPMKTPKVEDFLTEFEILCAHFSVETPIHQEDARPFCYEVDGTFQKKFARQVVEQNFPPYDHYDEGDLNQNGKGASVGVSSSGTSGSSGNGERMAGTFTSNNNTSNMFESKSVTLAAAAEILNNIGFKGGP